MQIGPFDEAGFELSTQNDVDAVGSREQRAAWAAPRQGEEGMKQRTFLGVLVALAVLIMPPLVSAQSADQINLQALQAKFEAHQARQAVLAKISEDKAAFVGELVSKWSAYAAEQWFTNDWAGEFQQVLMGLSPERLLAVNEATTYKDAVNAAFGRKTTPFVLATATDDMGQAIGSETSDLVYFPLAPCRILDTRLASAGAFAAGQTRAIYHNQLLASQGGNAAGCGVPTDPAAVAITLTVTAGTGFGWLTAWPYQGTMPNASVLNWNAGQTLANTTIVPTCQICGADFNINAAGSAVHVIADVVGYFWSPTATPFAFDEVYNTQSVADGSNTFMYSPSCPAGTIVIGGRGATGAWTGVNDAFGSIDTTNNRYGCSISNRTGANATIYCFAWCLSSGVPGR